jgi:hypothetical protein
MSTASSRGPGCVVAGVPSRMHPRRDRLRNVLPRLQARLQDVQAQEYAAGWLADYEQVKVKCDALAQEYGATYPKSWPS